MKKSALLAVSALSLGVVGLAMCTPVVSAISETQDATITVNVAGTLGIGNATPGALNVNINMNANDIKTQVSNIATTNNTGSTATLTVKDKDASTDLSAGAGKTIPTGTNVVKGTSTWGIKVGAGSYQAMPNNAGTAISIGNDGGATTKSYAVTYGVSTSPTQAAGTYTDQIAYTLTN